MHVVPLSWSSWLPLVLLLVDFTRSATALTAYTNTSTREANTPGNVGNYILKGLDSGSSRSGSSNISTLFTTSATLATRPRTTAFTATITPNWPIYGNVLTVTPGAAPDATSTAMQCWSEIATWRNQSASFWNAQIANRTWEVTSFPFSTTDTWSAISTIYPANVGVYTLCDGSPRANIRPKTTTLSGTTTLWGSTTTTLMPTFRPQPCTLEKHDCRMLYIDTDILATDDLELLTQCGKPAHLEDGLSCIMGGGPVDLIYFPVQRNDSGICGSKVQAKTTMPMIPGLSEIITLGRTFTSDSVYISFKTLFATYDGFWETVGPTFTDLIVPLHSSDISSHCGGWHKAYGTGTPLDYADLNWPVPASAYSCQYRCSVQHTRSATMLGGQIGWRLSTLPEPPGCKTIWSDINPILALPTKIRDMVPEWSSCSMWNDNIANFWFDPPLALKPANAAASVTRPTEPLATLGTPAAPSSLPGSPLAESTRLPAPDTAAVQSSSFATGATASIVGLPNHSSADSIDAITSPLVESADPSGEPEHIVEPSTLKSNPSGLHTGGQSAASTQTDRSDLSFVFNPLDDTSTEGGTDHKPTVLDPTIATAAAFSILTQALSPHGSQQTTPVLVPVPGFGASSQSRTPTAVQVDNGLIALGSTTIAVSEIPAVVTSRLDILTTNAAFASADDHTTVTSQQVHPPAMVIDGTTLSVGGPAATVAGQILTVASSGLFLVGTTPSSSLAETLPPVIVSSTPALQASSGGISAGVATVSSARASNSSVVSTTSSSTRAKIYVESRASTASTVESEGHRSTSTNRVMWLVTAAACAWKLCRYL